MNLKRTLFLFKFPLFNSSNCSDHSEAHQLSAIKVGMVIL